MKGATWTDMGGPSLSSTGSSSMFEPSHETLSESPQSSMEPNLYTGTHGHPGSATGYAATSVPPGKPSGTFVPGDMSSGGGSLTNKKYTKRNSIKKHANKSQNRSKSNNRKTITTRKNLKFKRMIKKHTTKYKTYKRKAKGRKLRGNKYKNNKTMRRMRCVRK